MTKPPGARPKPLVYHDQCIALDIVELARAGLLRPGYRVGSVELLCMDPESPFLGSLTMDVRTLMGEDSGTVQVYRPNPEDIPIEPVETAIGRRFRLVCRPCRGRVKRLYVPELPGGGGLPPPWACRACWKLGYRRGGRRGRLQSALERLASVRAIKADICRLEALILLTVREERAGRPGRS